MNVIMTWTWIWTWTWHDLTWNMTWKLDMNLDMKTWMWAWQLDNLKMANSRLGWVCSVILPGTARQIQLLQTIGSNVGSWSYRTWKPEVRLSCGVILPGTARHIQWPQQQVWCERLGCINELMPHDRVKSWTAWIYLTNLTRWFDRVKSWTAWIYLTNLTRWFDRVKSWTAWIYLTNLTDDS